jgi:hypothetical protein
MARLVLMVLSHRTILLCLNFRHNITGDEKGKRFVLWFFICSTGVWNCRQKTEEISSYGACLPDLMPVSGTVSSRERVLQLG